MGSCQKCFIYKNNEKEIEVKGSLNKCHHSVNMTDPSLKHSVRSNRDLILKKKDELNFNDIPNQLNFKRKSVDIQASKRKKKKYENEDGDEIIVNNKLVKNLKLSLDIEDKNSENNENRVKITSPKETLSNNKVITNEDEFGFEEESDELLRRKQADDLFDSNSDNETNEQIKNIIQLDHNYERNLYKNNDFYINQNRYGILSKDHTTKNNNYGFEEQLRRMSNNYFGDFDERNQNILGINNNKYYFSFNQFNPNFNINKSLVPNRSCNFIYSRIAEEKEENEEDRDSQIAKSQSTKKLHFSSCDEAYFAEKNKLKNLNNFNEFCEQQNKEVYDNDVSYEKNENDISYEIEDGDNENNMIDKNMNNQNKFNKKLENGKTDLKLLEDAAKIEVIKESPKNHVNLPIKIITEQKLHEKIYGIKHYSKKKYIITENFCDYIPEI